MPGGVAAVFNSSAEAHTVTFDEAICHPVRRARAES
jgi:hypothetical protein